MLFTFQQGQLGRRRVGGAAAALTYSPWNVGSLPANVAAIESNFRLTRSGGSNSVRGVYHPVTRSSGKYALRFLVKSAGGASSPGPACGVLIGSIGSYLGANSGGYGLWPNSSAGTTENTINNASTNNFLGNAASFVADTEVAVEIDIGAGKLWFGIGSFTGNPVAGTSQTYSFTPGSTIQVVADMYYPGEVKLRVPADFTLPASFGFTAGWPD